MVIIVICFLMGKNFKASNKTVNFPTLICLGNISNKFNYIDAEEVSLKEKVYDVQSITILFINLTY